MRLTLIRLLHERRGVTIIEFAFVLPFLLTITMAGLEMANLAVTVLRVNQLAMLAADNAARVRNSIDETDVEQVIAGIKFAGSGIKFGDNGRVIISAFEPNGQTGTRKGYKITWQRCFGANNVTSSYGVQGDGATTNSMASGMGPPDKKVTPVENNALMFAEIRYNYRPVVGSYFVSPFELTARQAFSVRDRASQTLNNSTNMSNTRKRLCDANHLSNT